MSGRARPGEEAHWNRPSDGTSVPAVPGSAPTGSADYAGPPPTVPPPPGWRTPVVVRPGSPRPLPQQDPARLDAEEQSARTLTYGVAMVAGAVMLLLILVLCGRALF